jgi:hypothetical protein
MATAFRTGFLGVTLRTKRRFVEPARASVTRHLTLIFGRIWSTVRTFELNASYAALLRPRDSSDAPEENRKPTVTSNEVSLAL